MSTRNPTYTQRQTAYAPVGPADSDSEADEEKQPLTGTGSGQQVRDSASHWKSIVSSDFDLVKQVQQPRRQNSTRCRAGLICLGVLIACLVAGSVAGYFYLHNSGKSLSSLLGSSSDTSTSASPASTASDAATSASADDLETSSADSIASTSELASTTATSALSSSLISVELSTPSIVGGSATGSSF